MAHFAESLSGIGINDVDNGVYPGDRNSMNKQVAPPPAIGFARVIEYAVIEEPIQWTGQQRR